MNNHLLTIGVPVFNEERFLEETLDSIVSQSFTNCRILISDNCSQDSSYEIAKRFLQRDKRVELVKQNPPLDAVGNFRYLISKANTKYFMWAGAHDLLINNFVEEGIKVLESDDRLSLVYPQTLWIDAESKDIVTSWRNDDLDTIEEKEFESGLLKVVANTFCCNAIYGIMRTDFAKEIPFVKMIGADHLVLFHLACKGRIHHLLTPGFKSRIVREETMEELKQRYIKQGITTEKDKYPYEFHTANYFKYILSMKNLNLLRKIKLIDEVRKVMHRKFHVTLRGLIRYYFYSRFGI